MSRSESLHRALVCGAAVCFCILFFGASFWTQIYGGFIDSEVAPSNHLGSAASTLGAGGSRAWRPMADHLDLHELHPADQPHSTAVCTAGELRSLMDTKVSHYFALALLQPLHADLFMVVSLSHTQSWHKWSSGQFNLSNISSAVHNLRHTLKPKEMAIAADGRELDLLAQSFHLDLETRQCRKGLHSFQSLFLRWRICLSMIQRSEGSRRRLISPGWSYSYVIRTRPDVYLAGAITPAVLRRKLFAPSGKWIAYAWDFVAIMSRSAADTSLRQCPLMRNASECWLANRDTNYTVRANYKVVGEFCNPCTCRLAGISAYEMMYRVSDVSKPGSFAHVVRWPWELSAGVTISRLPNVPPNGTEHALIVRRNSVHTANESIHARSACFIADEDAFVRT